MKATIVIPNINGKGWLKDSIESVYAQTEQDFELIVVDNGSTDESLEQARSYCSRPNFTLIENGRADPHRRERPQNFCGPEPDDPPLRPRTGRRCG